MNERNFILIIGFVLFFLGWLNIFTGFIIIFFAEDTIILGLGLESMVFFVDIISEKEQVFHGMFRIVLGLIILVIANSLIAQKHIMFRPDLRDCKDCLKPFRR
jgi:hypothetical protein